MSRQNLEEMRELVDFETGEKINGPCLVILKSDDDFVLIDAERYEEKMLGGDWIKMAENYDLMMPTV